jgi:primosomal protein N' (replication factor Y)
VLFGSATPSIESYYAAEQGVFLLHELKERYGGVSLPAVEIRRLDGAQTGQILSAPLRAQTMESIRAGRQVIFLLNRRGFAPFVICARCSKVVECPHCSIGMCLHQQGRLLCHYCGHERALPPKCPSCGHEKLDHVGAGTQRVEEVIARAFPSCVLRRLDSDVSRRRGEAEELIRDMAEGRVDILLGTQMVAKGLDFDGVDLVCVLLADIGLHMPDYRAVERVFSLLMQVAGRSGRRGIPGRVLVQTGDPDNAVFDFVQRHDYEGFYRREIGLRQTLQYPPFCRLVRLLARSADESAAVKAIESLAALLQPGLPADCHLLGPAAAPLKKIADNFRYHLLLKTRSLEALRPVVQHALAETNVSGVYIEVDVDPADVL